MRDAIVTPSYRLGSDRAGTVLAADSVSKRFGRTWALTDVNLQIPRSSITGLVGPNGAGKSTLMRTWMGFERPSRGSVRVLGAEHAAAQRRALARLAYLPQTPSLYRELTVADHLDFVAHYRRQTFDRSRAVRRLADLGVRLDARSGALSGGQAAQLGLALALGMRAEVHLLDEPLASLDPLARREFIDVLLDDVGETGATVVMSSHVVTDVERACDRLVVLGVGRKVLDESIDEIRRTHWAATSNEAESETVIAPARAGRSAVVRSAAAPAPDATLASLDDIVMAYLALARG